MTLDARIVFEQVRPAGTALTWCVHRPVAWPEGTAPGARTWQKALRFVPPRPGPVSGNGYAVLEVTDRADLYRFTSGAEIDEFVRVMGNRVLPNAEALAAHYGMSLKNQIWISRVPKRDYPRRAALVGFLRRNEAPFRRLIAQWDGPQR